MSADDCRPRSHGTHIRRCCLLGALLVLCTLFNAVAESICFDWLCLSLLI